MAPTPAIIVIAKRPEPGRVKTRLCPQFSAAGAADVAAAALSDTLDVVDGTAASHRRLCFEGDPNGWARPGWEVRAQCTGDLDARLADAFAGLDGPALLVGMDTPQITTPQLLDFDPVRFDACLGRTPDGGFWAIGFRDPELAALAVPGVRMSTAQTGRHQLQRLRALGLRVQLLDEVRDVDTYADARAVAKRLPRSRFAAAVADSCRRSA